MQRFGYQTVRGLLEDWALNWFEACHTSAGIGSSAVAVAACLPEHSADCMTVLLAAEASSEVVALKGCWKA